MRKLALSCLRASARLALTALLIVVLLALPAEATGVGKIRAIVVSVLDQLGITTAGAYTAKQASDADLTAIAALTRTRGDLIVGGASDWTDLATGAAGTVLVGGTDPAWSATPTVTGLITGNGTVSLPAITGPDLDSGIGFGTNAVILSAGGGNSAGIIACSSNVLSNWGQQVIARTTNATETPTCITITNEGASGEVIRTLPLAVTGMHYIAIVETAQLFQIKASTGDVIRGVRSVNVVLGTVESSAAAGYWRSNVPGAWLCLVAINATTWQVVSIGGTWTIDS